MISGSSTTSDLVQPEPGASVEADRTAPTRTLTSPLIASPDIEQETLFSVLAEQASTRSARDLTLTAIAGAANAWFVLQYFGVVWLASALATASAYGVWGLADRALLDRLALADGETAGGAALTVLLRVVRAVAATAGVVAALATAAGFMLAAFPNWGMSG